MLDLLCSGATFAKLIERRDQLCTQQVLFCQCFKIYIRSQNKGKVIRLLFGVTGKNAGLRHFHVSRSWFLLLFSSCFYFEVTVLVSRFPSCCPDCLPLPDLFHLCPLPQLCLVSVISTVFLRLFSLLFHLLISSESPV